MLLGDLGTGLRILVKIGSKLVKIFTIIVVATLALMHGCNKKLQLHGIVNCNFSCVGNIVTTLCGSFESNGTIHNDGTFERFVYGKDHVRIPRRLARSR